MSLEVWANGNGTGSPAIIEHASQGPGAGS